MEELRLELEVNFQVGGKRLAHPFEYFVLTLGGSSKFLRLPLGPEGFL